MYESGIYKPKGRGWKGLLVGLAIGAATGFGIANYDEIDKRIESISMLFPDAQFREYKGEWEPYTFRAEDKTMYNVALRCVKKLGANGEHWRNQIGSHPKNRGINWGRLKEGDVFWVPKDCDCSSKYRK